MSRWSFWDKRGDALPAGVVSGGSSVARVPDPEDRPHTFRDPYLDNAKVLLIALVVVGHLLESVRNSGLSTGVYTWIYLFHMPAFVLVSGYLSRSFTGTPRQCKALVISLLAPYVVFQAILALEAWLWRGGPFSLNFFIPTFALWYVVALFAWRLAAPLLRSIPHPLLIAIGLSLLSVVYGGLSLELTGARIFSFLPFFVLGFVTTPERFERFKAATARLWVRLAVGAFLLGVLLACYLSRGWVVRTWLYWDGHYTEWGFSNAQNLLLRAALLVIAIIMMLAVLVLVPRGRMFFTRFGRTTLYIYLLQSAIIYPLMPTIGGWAGWSKFWVIALMAGGVLLALALGTPVAQAATRWLVDPLTFFASVFRRLGANAPMGPSRDVGHGDR